jgi:hypothetical protein
MFRIIEHKRVKGKKRGKRYIVSPPIADEDQCAAMAAEWDEIARDIRSGSRYTCEPEGQIYDDDHYLPGY